MIQEDRLSQEEWDELIKACSEADLEGNEDLIRERRRLIKRGNNMGNIGYIFGYGLAFAFIFGCVVGFGIRGLIKDE